MGGSHWQTHFQCVINYVCNGDMRDAQIIFNNAFLNKFLISKYRGVTVMDAKTKPVGSTTCNSRTQNTDLTFTANRRVIFTKRVFLYIFLE